MANNLRVNTHYKMPWIVWKREYSFNVPHWNYTQTSFNHGLPFTPLLIGQWSDNANFNPAYDLSVDVPGGASGGQAETTCNVSADATKINIIADNNKDYDCTYYLRLMALAPPDYDGEVTPVDYSSAFRYNSKYRYQKLFMAGRTTTAKVVHNLGYLPQARVWLINARNNTVVPAGAELTSSELITAADSNFPYYYHIYLDGME